MRIATIVAIAFVACGSDATFSSDELAIYKTVVAQVLARGPRGQVERLPLWKETGLPPGWDTPRREACFTEQRLDDVALINDFRAKNQEPRVFATRQLGDSARIVNRDDVDRFIRANPDKKDLANQSDPWDPPFLDSVGSYYLYTLSRIGFSSDKDSALVLVKAQRGMDSWGVHYLLKRHSSGWNVREVGCGWLT